METPKQYFTGDELQRQITVIDWHRTLPILYAATRRIMYKRFLSDPDKGVYGKNFKDYVHDAITLLMEGARNWAVDVKFEAFILFTIRSLISSQIKKHHLTLSVDASEDEILLKHYESMNTSFDVARVKEIISKKLNTDDISINIFECWSEGIFKPAEIRELYGYSEPEYNNAKKRLDRVLVDIRKDLKND